MKKGIEKIERRENSAKVNPDHFQYKLWANYKQFIESKLQRFPVNTCANLGIGGFTLVKPPASLIRFCERRLSGRMKAHSNLSD